MLVCVCHLPFHPGQLRRPLWGVEGWPSDVIVLKGLRVCRVESEPVSPMGLPYIRLYVCALLGSSVLKFGC